MGKPLAIVSVLLLVLTYLLIERQSSDQIPRGRMQQSLQAMQLHDAELNRDVLMARAGLLANYDSLAQTGRKLSLDLETLKKQSAILAPRAEGLTSNVDALASALHRKLRLVEYLKSDNALLRNSLACFTQSLGAVREQRNAEKLALEIASLSHIMLRFVQAPEPAIKKEADAALASIPGAPVASNNIELLKVHGRLIVDVLPRVDGLLGEIVRSSAASNAQILQRAVLDYGGKAEARALRFRLLLYLVALILLFYLLHQYRGLRA